MQIINSLHVNGEDRLISVTSPSFIGATKNILSALLNGASVHMQPPLRPAELVNEIQRRGITMLRISPTLMRRIAEALHPHQSLDRVRLVELFAERAEWSDFDIFRQAFRPGTLLATQLTATEGDATRWFIDPTLRALGERLPVGRIIPDRSLTIVDDNGRLVTDGEVGELVIKSPYVALGFWRNPEATARQFAVDPIDPKTRIYKTGDLARRRRDGLFEFVGRKDHQIKLRGYRIEIGEIEFALKDCSGVEDAAVVVQRNEAGLPRSLAAYVEPKRGVDDLTPRKLAAALNTRVPGYMIPATIVVVDNLPRLPNLKIDREELRRRNELESKRPSVSTASAVEANTEVQEKLLALWRAVLNRQDIGPDDDFFLCGGDSLLALNLFHRIVNELHYKLPLAVLSEAPTVNLFYACLDTAARGLVSNMVRINAAGRQRPLFAVHGVHGHTLGLLPTMRSLGPDQPVFGLQPPKMDWASVGCTTVPQVAAHFIGEVKTVQPRGPYRLVGTSFGGLVVFEMALQLQNLGEPVEYLALVDTSPPTCLLDNGIDLWREPPGPSRQQAGPIEEFHLRVYETHLSMASAYALNSRLNQNVFRGELTYFCCTGNPIIAKHDRRRLWQLFASRFRLLQLAGPHDVTTPGSDQTAFQDLLRASLKGEVQMGSDPGTVFNRAYQIGNREGHEYIFGSMGDAYRIDQNRMQGNIESVFIEDEVIQIKGWAVEPCRRQRAQTIAVFLDDRYLGYGATGEQRPDVADKLAVRSVLHAGFNFHFQRKAMIEVGGKPRVFVLSNDSTAAELTSAC